MKVKNRVKKNEDFQKIIRDNKKIVNKLFIVYYKKNEINHARVGISTSKKLGNAIVRAKVRRQIRSMCQEIISFDKSVDYIIIIRKPYLDNEFSANKESLAKLLTNIKED